MKDKQHYITMMKEEFDRWEALLAGLTEAQIMAPELPDHLSIKDGMAHLRAWQQRSIARAESALHNTEPDFPKWPAELDPDSEENTDRINAWIHESARSQPWSSVHRDWRSGFLRLLELGEAIPENDFLDANRYAWLHSRPLSFIYEASYEHHHIDHYEPLLAWLHENGLG